MHFEIRLLLGAAISETFSRNSRDHAVTRDTIYSVSAFRFITQLMQLTSQIPIRVLQAPGLFIDLLDDSLAHSSGDVHPQGRNIVEQSRRDLNVIAAVRYLRRASQ